MMERLLEIASLCCARGFLPPKTVCMMRCCCSELRRTRVAWDAYEPLIEIDLSCPSAVGWLWQNITSNRALSLTNIPPAEQMLKLLLDDGRALTSLQIKDPHIKSLPSLPAKLEGLCVSGCSMLCSLPDLPASMELLQCEDCRSLTALPDLSKTAIAELHCSRCTSLIELPALPPTVDLIAAPFCIALGHIPALPAGLTTLELEGCSSLQELLALPASLLTLDCQNCKALRHLPDLRHTAMSYMDCSGCELLQELPDLPRTLASLYVEHIRGLTQLPLLPNLRCMSRLSACGSGIRQLSVLPPYLHELDCSRTAIQQLPRKLPATLDRLSVSHCGQLRALPEELPAGLDELDCEHCQQLQALPAALPEQLRWLSIKGCTAIERLPVLPGSLEYLDVEECAALKQVRLQNADGATLTVRLHR